MTARARPLRAGPPREVRLIGGAWRRSKLPVAERPGLRPTPDRVRESLFKWSLNFGGGFGFCQTHDQLQFEIAAKIHGDSCPRNFPPYGAEHLTDKRW